VAGRDRLRRRRRHGVSFTGFRDAVETAARGLRARGLQPGDAVAVASGNTLDLATAVFACARARLVLVGLNTRLAAPQWTYMLERMSARLALGSPAFLPGLREAGAQDALLLATCCARAGPRSTPTRRPRTRPTPSSSPPAPPGAPRPRRWCTAARCTAA
jgi:acyl-CoA synthetase (AMP-forming)/AMP-acid ligase II